MRNIDLMIDVGSRNITVFKKDSGVVLKEPSIVAVDADAKKTEFVASGEDVKTLLAKGGNLQIVYPIMAGAIDHYNGAVYLFRQIFAKVGGNKALFAPKFKVLCAVSCGLENSEKLDIEKALLEAGASTVTIMESPIAVSRNYSDDSCFVVDIGASKTEIAFVDAHDGIVAGCSADIGGDELNRVIMDYIVDTYRVSVPDRSVEKLKIKIATMYDNDASSARINGRSIIDSKPKNIRISSSELMKAMSIVFDKIAEIVSVVRSDVEAMSDSYAEDIANNGIYISGGVANIQGLEAYLGTQLGVKVTRDADPDNAVVNGGSTFFYNRDLLASMLNIRNYN